MLFSYHLADFLWEQVDFYYSVFVVHGWTSKHDFHRGPIEHSHYLQRKMIIFSFWIIFVIKLGKVHVFNQLLIYLFWSQI